MVKEPTGGPEETCPDDGLEVIIEAFKTQAVELIGTMEVISQQAPLFIASHEPGDTKRTAICKMVVELTSKVSKLDTLASKTMNMIFVGDPNETESNIPCTSEQPSIEH
jgi:hypothetical protein